jgi:cytoskeletal protein CcmA (bactofilin family)
MPPAKPALQPEPTVATPLEDSHRHAGANLPAPGPRRIDESAVRQFPARPKKDVSFQPRVPVIIGEATYRGLMPLDGIITGQLGANGNTMAIKQRPRTGPSDGTPELTGELSFKDMLRINGHVAGKVSSYTGTLIVDASAKVEAQIDVGVCVISGIVVGDVVGHERVEVGAGAIVTGNISTPALSIKPGAVFHGDCRMLKEENRDTLNTHQCPAKAGSQTT